MQHQNQAMYFEQKLVFIGVGPQVAAFAALHDGAPHGRMPCLHRLGQGIAHGTAAIVELNGAADVDATRIKLDCGTLHPVIEQGTQPGHAARLVEAGKENLLLETSMVFMHHGDLQLLARAEMGEHARLAHAGELGDRTDGQAFQPHVRGQVQGRLDDGILGLLALLQGPARRRLMTGSDIGGHARTQKKERSCYFA